MNGQKSLKKQWKINEVSLIFDLLLIFHRFLSRSDIVITLFYYPDWVHRYIKSYPGVLPV